MADAQTRLKMHVEGVVTINDKDGNANSENITLRAVYGSLGNEEANKVWSKYTPSGELRFSVTNPNVMGTIKQGQFYFADLIPCGRDD